MNRMGNIFLSTNSVLICFEYNILQFFPEKQLSDVYFSDTFIDSYK